MSVFQKIYASVIIPGIGNIISNGVVIIKDSVIYYVGCKDIDVKLSENDVELNPIKIPVIMPGLWDCHVHFFGTTDIALKNHAKFMDCMAIEPKELAITRSVQQAKMALNAGFTSLREVGGYGVYIKKLIEEGTIMGPNIYPCGKALSQTSGHGDHHNIDLCTVKTNPKWSRIVDGIDECIRAVRENIRDGATCIKVMSSGGAASIIDPLNISQFNDGEMKAIIDECDRNEMIVAAHAHGAHAIERNIRMGVHSIEHATSLDDRLAQMMKEKGCVYVPTQWIGPFLLKDGMDSISSPPQKLMDAIQKAQNALKVAIKNGVTICAGTDIWYDQYGNNIKEIQYYMDAGMNILDAIQTITANGPLSLSKHGPGTWKAPKSGQIKVGFDADIIGLQKNPIKNLNLLYKPQNIKIVWKGGKIVKNIYKKSKL